MNTVSNAHAVGQARACARHPEHHKRALAAEFFARCSFLRAARAFGPVDRRTRNAFAEWDRQVRDLSDCERSQNGGAQ